DTIRHEKRLQWHQRDANCTAARICAFALVQSCRSVSLARMARWWSIAATVLVFGLLMPRSKAHWGREQIEQRPIGRPVRDHDQRLSRQTIDSLTTYYLARLHAMAYSTNPLKFPAKTNQTDPVFGHYDAGVPPQVFPAQTPAALQVARQHLTNAIALYERAALLFRKSTNAAAYACWSRPSNWDMPGAWIKPADARKPSRPTAAR